MDLPLFVRVLGRHRNVVAAGVCLAVLLAVLSYGRPGFEDWRPVLKYREQEQWQSQARVLVTLPGFSSGRSLLRPSSVASGAKANAIESAEARLSGLAVLYAGLATGDEVKKIVRRGGPIRGKVVTAAATATGGTATLPIVEITSNAPSANGSRELVNRYADALRIFIEREQKAFGVPPRERVALRPLNRGGRTELVVPRGKTLPVIVFLTIVSATIGLAFVRENLKRGTPSLVDVEAPVIEIDQQSEPHATRHSRW